MIKRISDNIYKIKGLSVTSNCYLIRDKKILVDTGSLKNREFLIESLKKLNCPAERIRVVILTHLHYDHCSNLDLFKNAKIYASKEEINNLKRFKAFYTYSLHVYKQIKNIKILPLKTIKGFKIIHTAGHTSGSICLLYKDILFSGDTLFNRTIFGRTDLISSSPLKLIKSIKKLDRLKYKLLCPGH